MRGNGFLNTINLSSLEHSLLIWVSTRNNLTSGNLKQPNICHIAHVERKSRKKPIRKATALELSHKSQNQIGLVSKI